MIPQRNTGESDFQYHKRLVEGKLVDKTLADIDYSELSEALYGQQYSSDFTRRMMYGSRATLDLLEKSAVNSCDCADVATNIDDKKRELQEERYKLAAAKLELQRESRQKSRFDLFYEQVRDASRRLPMPELCEVSYNESGHEWVVGLGDLHYGAVFESVHNSYSRSECKRRFEFALAMLKKECVANGIDHLTILNVADSIQGILRISDVQLNDISVVDCVVEISRLIASFLNELSAVCEIDYYHVPSANHSQTRPLGSKASELATEDLERLIINWVSDLLADNPRVSVKNTVGRDYVEFNIFDFSCISEHGHQIKNVETCAEQLSALHRKMYDYVFLGHRHASNERIVAEGEHHNIEILTCPSFVGSDPYSDKLLKGSKAMIKLYEFDPVYGHVGSKNLILN